MARLGNTNYWYQRFSSIPKFRFPASKRKLLQLMELILLIRQFGNHRLPLMACPLEVGNHFKHQVIILNIYQRSPSNLLQFFPSISRRKCLPFHDHTLDGHEHLFAELPFIQLRDPAIGFFFFYPPAPNYPSMDQLVRRPEDSTTGIPQMMMSL